MSLSLHLSSGRWPRLLVAFLLSTALTGCGGDEIKVYRVPKEKATEVAVQAGALPEGHPEIGGLAQPRLVWKKPEGWNEAKASEMRVASFNVKTADGKQADVSIIPLPGTAGGDATNVNRWRGQVGLASLSPEELKKTAEAVEIAGQRAELYDLSGQAPSTGEAARILGVIQHRDGTAWFFKMTGGEALVAAEKPRFVEFLKSLQFQVAEAQPQLPPAHPPISGTATAAPTASSLDGKPTWQVPAGWREIPGGEFLVAKFTIAGEGGAQAAVNVSMSGGDGGGLLANVNRWRVQQLGLPAWYDADLKKETRSMEIEGGKAVLVELSGTDARTGQLARLVGVVVPRTGQTWFYKLMGDPKVVAGHKDEFARFVQTVKY